jgi:Ni,Fe-hydrogenase maturation factor
VSGRIVVIGVGNALRGDDAAGLAVAERVRAHANDGV